jgi:WD40 repeat protein
MAFEYGDQSRIESLAFSPDGTLLASGSNDGKIILRDATTFRPLGLHLSRLMVNIRSAWRSVRIVD